MDAATRDLLTGIRDALTGMADWRCVAVSSAANDALDGDPGAAADWLRDFLATRAQGSGSR
jgi:hypothetical protein